MKEKTNYDLYRYNQYVDEEVSKPKRIKDETIMELIEIAKRIESKIDKLKDKKNE